MHSKFRPAKYLKNNPHKKPRDGNTEKDFGYANCCEEERSSRDPAEDKHQGNTDNGERGVHQQNLDENIENERIENEQLQVWVQRQVGTVGTDCLGKVTGLLDHVGSAGGKVCSQPSSEFGS